jgi:hypothetical protein
MTPRDNRLASRATRSSSSSGDGDALSHVQHLRGMFLALEQLGYDIDELLAAGGLRRKDVEDPDAYVSPAIAPWCSRAHKRSETSKIWLCSSFCEHQSTVR